MATGAPTRIAILGGTGYGASELLRLLLSHPGTEVVRVVSRSQAGRPVASVHPQFRGVSGLRFEAAEPAEAARDVDCIFLALPHGAALEAVPRILEAAPRVGVVDLSGDFRLKDPATYREAYGAEHTCPRLLEGFVYGLTELARDRLRGTRRVANPGCFATGAILALAPLALEGLLGEHVVVDSKTGSSGSGAEPRAGTHHPERAEDFRAYKVLQHQHLPEIRAALGLAAHRPALHFVPHSAPMARGIYTTAYVMPPRPVEAGEAQAIYRRRYGGERFVRVLDDGETPQARVVRYSNFCDLSVHAGPGVLVVLTALDNLVKGMAGQAVQNMNLMFGHPEDAGLGFPGVRP
ncbi:MAG: N-acetyl-gamma-glutamyl-phosphate reductase [Planctomycetes bacterium]|nr:N-acetyl-gamma-glutamyl-phosphate reductase [Planctomycetota bacterium]